MSVSKHRDRIGCDICKEDTSTEAFIGFCGNVMWICGGCFGETITKKKGKGAKK